MADTPEEVRRELEMTRERVSDTLNAIEQRVKESVNVKRRAADLIGGHPWTAVGLAAGAGFLFAASRADRKAARATVSGTSAIARKAPGAARSALSGILGAVSERVGTTVHDHLREQLLPQVDGWVEELTEAVAPRQRPDEG